MVNDLFVCVDDDESQVDITLGLSLNLWLKWAQLGGLRK